MSDPTSGPDRPRRPTEDRPILTGLVALVGVGIGVGLILGLVVLIGVRVTGIGGDDVAASTSRDDATMYLPRPERTTASDGPLITLDADPSSSATPSASPTESESPTESPSPETGINLSAGTTAVGPMEQIDLTGTYPDGEGAVLQVQRFQAGAWADFNVTVVVSNQTFATYVQTSVVGLNRFRMVDTDSGAVSNEVRVRVG